MPDILLATLNAKYPHAAFGLRYLLANLEPANLAHRAQILEFDINQRPTDILESLLAHNPKIIGLGVYIWNAAQSTTLAADLKRLRPDITLVLGGPEISHETDQQEITKYADYIITGEADVAFASLCTQLLAGKRPLQKVIPADLPQFAESRPPSPKGATGAATQPAPSPVGEGRGEGRAPVAPPSSILHPPSSPPISLPYHLYTPHDLAHRVVYVEASRGCPFKCEFCLSSLDVPVRNVPLEPFLRAMDDLLRRGLRQFKFVDRTFNLNLSISRAILQFFLDRYTPGLFLHFEMIPDRLPDALRSLIQQFPPGALQFEVGIQTFNPTVAALISRRQDYAKLEDNLRFLREQTGVHIHTDLIVGLPGEDLPSFGQGFDRLVRLRPQEIQVGILKRLRGTPITRHDTDWAMIYSPHPPYEILQTKLLDFPTMQRMRRFSRYWDLLSNSGNFRDTLPLLWQPVSPSFLSPGTPGEGKGGDLLPPSPGTPGEGRGEGLPHEPNALISPESTPSPFTRFLDLSDRLYAHMGRNHGIALQDLAEFLFTHLTTTLGHPPETVATKLWSDYQRTGRSDRPKFLQPFIAHTPISPRKGIPSAPPRQARHLS